MNYLEFIKNEESQVVEAIVFREDAVESFFTKMEEADDGDCFELINSLYFEVMYYLNEEGVNFTMVRLNGTDYEMHLHMFTTYLVRMFYNSQYYENLLSVLEFYSDLELPFEHCFTTTLSNLFRKLTEEPMENFVKEVQIVCPGYTVRNEETILTQEDIWWESLSEVDKRLIMLEVIEEAHKNFPNAELMTFPPID